MGARASVETWEVAVSKPASPVAAIGLLTPTIAAGTMATSSVSVVLNALRLKRFDAEV